MDCVNAMVSEIKGCRNDWQPAYSQINQPINMGTKRMIQGKYYKKTMQKIHATAALQYYFHI